MFGFAEGDGRGGPHKRITGDLAVPGVLCSWREKNEAFFFLGLMKAYGQNYDVEVSWRFYFTLKVLLECRVLRSQRKV